MADLDKYLAGIGIDMNEEDDVDSKQQPDSPLLAQDDDYIASTNIAPPIVAFAPLAGNRRERCETFLVNLLRDIDAAYTVEIRESASGDLKVGVYGGDPAKLIGRSGKTLSALEYLCNVIVNKSEGVDNRIRISIDVGNYKRRRDDKLIAIARRAANKVRRNGRPYELRPMDAAERRVVHLEISRIRGVDSQSLGNGPDRRVVVVASDF